MRKRLQKDIEAGIRSEDVIQRSIARTFAEIAEKKGYQTLSFDLPEHGERTNGNDRCDIWNGIHDLNVIADYAFSKWNQVFLYACSLGAYFSLHACSGRKIEKCLFQSPVVDMEYLIRQMFLWFQVTEEKLCVEKEIPTPVDTLRWDYYQYVKEHPFMQDRDRSIVEKWLEKNI